MAVLLGQYLAHCEVRSGHDAALGVLVAALAVRQAQDSKRFVPEAIAFLSALVHCAAEDGAASTAGLPAHQAHQIGAAWLHPLPAAKSGKRAATAPVFSPAGILERPADDPYFGGAELRAAALHCALQTLSAAADSLASSSAGVVLIAPCRDTVVRLTEASCSRLVPQNTLAAAAAVVAAHARAASAVHPPLQLNTRKREPIKTFNPRFEEDGYVQGRDYDIDRERAEARSLKKQIAREAKVRAYPCSCAPPPLLQPEQRTAACILNVERISDHARSQGAARELRKDNRFLAEERTRALQVESAEREGKYRATMSFLEQQEADFKSGGQGGGMKRKKKQ
jgi:nucleolar protein 14